MVDWLRSDIARRARDAGMSIVVTGYAGLDVEADTGQEHDASRLRIGAPARRRPRNATTAEWVRT